jgi:hypothetical protein
MSGPGSDTCAMRFAIGGKRMSRRGDRHARNKPQVFVNGADDGGEAAGGGVSGGLRCSGSLYVHSGTFYLISSSILDAKTDGYGKKGMITGPITGACPPILSTLACSRCRPDPGWPFSSARNLSHLEPVRNTRQTQGKAGPPDPPQSCSAAASLLAAAEDGASSGRALPVRLHYF